MAKLSFPSHLFERVVRRAALPPGVAYLTALLPALVAPPLLTIALLLLLHRTLRVASPPWLTAVLCVVSVPGAVVVRIQYTDLVDRRTAASLGAVLPPDVATGFGGLGTVFLSVRDLAAGYPGQLLGQRCVQHGNTFSIRIGWKNRVFTAEPQYIKSMLATDFASFEKGPTFRDVFQPLLGTGVFASDGAMWKFHRDMTRPFFEKHRISDFDIFDAHVATAIAQATARLHEGHPLDVQELVGRVTLDCASAFLFGHDFRALAAPLAYPFYRDAARPRAAQPAAFAPAFLAAQALTAVRIRYADHWPLAEFWTDRMAAPMRSVGRVLDPILEGVVAKRQARRQEKRTGEPETLLEHLVEYTQDIKVLRDELLNISVAGRDTVTSLTTFAVYMLAEHPAVLAKLRQEIFSRVGEKGRPDVEDIKSMKYLRAVLNETLRLYPPIPLNFRTSTKGVVWPATTPGAKPFYIPPNTMIPYGPIVMHRRTDLWGPDALKFDPERFIDERLQKYLIPNPFIFLPFNAGPRICLGQQFAYQEASFILIRLLQAFASISLAPSAQPPESRVPDDWHAEGAPEWMRREKVRPMSSLALYVMGGLWVTMAE
ncbi:cytochrome P450 [Mycena belliarum]|uniref:Cytochrome P450 n=1 Tax=Mycena belliarum TaxID=1033014 RepID=A0AAD6UFC1_9AGAR|nr:cytochrome P450 [Mycena belliae]